MFLFLFREESVNNLVFSSLFHRIENIILKNNMPGPHMDFDKKKQTKILLLIFLIFFVISLMSNILGPIIPGIIESFSLSYGLAGFLPFAFFVAYGVMSLPSGLLVERWREKPVLLLAFSLAAIGAFWFQSPIWFCLKLLIYYWYGDGHASGGYKSATESNWRRGAFRF